MTNKTQNIGAKQMSGYDLFFKAKALMGRELHKKPDHLGWEGLYLTQESFKALYEFLRNNSIEGCPELYLYSKPMNPGFALHNQMPVKREEYEDNGANCVDYEWGPCRDSEISESSFSGTLDEMVNQLDPSLLNKVPLLEHQTKFSRIRVYKVR